MIVNNYRTIAQYNNTLLQIIINCIECKEIRQKITQISGAKVSCFLKTEIPYRLLPQYRSLQETRGT